MSELAADVSDPAAEVTANEQLRVATTVQHRRLTRPLTFNFRAALSILFVIALTFMVGVAFGLGLLLKARQLHGSIDSKIKRIPGAGPHDESSARCPPRSPPPASRSLLQ